ncbi:MAG: S8 family peptidase [Pirellulales bacterium]|nr:S8 family peptidase [Pirellulales bacterium]
MSTWRLPPIFEVSSAILPHELTDLIDWGQKLVGLPAAWKQTRGEGIDVAVLDTGCDTSHPDLQGAIIGARDFTDSRSGAEDAHGHGTHCASVIGARADGRGIRGGASACQLLIGKVLGDSGAGSDQSIVDGLEWAVDQGADVISMSLGSPTESSTIRDAIRRATFEGCFVICAAGNTGQADSVYYPGKWTETIAVSAVDEGGRIASYSSRGPEVDIAAPGSNVLGAAPGGGYVRMSGTSMATPLVSAVVALVLSRHKKLGSRSSTPITTIADLREHLARTSMDVGKPGKDEEYGYGLIQPGVLLSNEEGTDEPGTIELCGGLKLVLPADHAEAAVNLTKIFAALRSSAFVERAK